MWIHNGVATLASDIVDHRLEVTQIRRVEWATQPGSERAYTLHGKGNTERVEAFAEEKVNGGSCWLLSIKEVAMVISYAERDLLTLNIVRTQT